MEPPEEEVGEPTRVLVVDDDRATADLWAQVLDRRGFDVRAATHPEGALALAATFRPEVVVLDLGLPSMDGHELGIRLRELCGNVRLIAVTGDSSAAARERSAARGFDAHFVKPVAIAALAGFVRTL